MEPSRTVSSSGRTISWDIDEIPDDGTLIELIYYIKANDTNDADLSYPVFDEAYLFYNTVLDVLGIPTPGTIVNHFPNAYIKGGAVSGGGSSGGSSGSGGSGLPSDPNGIPVGSGGTTGTGGSSSAPSTGAEGHQENRELAGNGGWGDVSDIAPNVTEIKGSTDSSGRSRVEVSLTNGNQMRYQWQFKNSAGEWEDIFGATGSRYTLGKQFTVGQEYELRAKIINPAGKMSFTEIVKLTMEAGNGGGLQVQEERPSIDSESLMDAGEEITVANTASNGQILAVVMGIVLVAIAAMMIVGYRRRKN